VKRRNARSLDSIAVDIHQLQRGNIIDIGDLLLEAKSQCEHGDWLKWLNCEFDWSVDTAERYMRVSALNVKFRSLRNLKLSATTLYGLTYQEEDELPAMVAELAKYASVARLRALDAGRVIKIGIGRHHFGDHPDATLLQLAELFRFSDSYEKGFANEKAAAALLEFEPDTDETAVALVRTVVADHFAEEAGIQDDDAEQEKIDFILDGPAPELPPPTIPPEPQKLETESDWDTGSFVNDVTGLFLLHAKPVARFVGKCRPDTLRKVAAFLTDIAAATETGDKAKAA
jgi:hypothetical protein